MISVGSLKYEVRDSCWCSPQLDKKKYMNFIDAKAACSVNEKCPMFYDFRGRGYYYLCGETSHDNWSTRNSTLYMKYEGTFGNNSMLQIYAMLKC